MYDISAALAGFAEIFTITNFLYIVAGIILGQIVGAIPGIGPIMTMAIAIPFTFTLSPLVGISFLIGINKGGFVGGAIPSILMNTPGSPDAAATALDGYPLAKQGKPLKALKMSLYSSVTGDTFSDIVLLTVSAPLAIYAIKMGAMEVLALMILSFSVIAGLLGQSYIKGILSAVLGALFATVGTDESGSERMIFGFYEFYDGFPLISVAIGMLALPQIISNLAKIHGKSQKPVIKIDHNQPLQDRRISFLEYWRCRFALLRGAIIGTLIGAIPGVGSTAAAFMSYVSTKQVDKHPETFGTGNIKGIAATESANSAVVGANLIPMLTLGIPGNVGAALLISAFMIHGIQPGPSLFETQGVLIYAILGSMVMANFINLAVGLLGLRLWVRVIKAPETLIYFTSLVLCIVGVYLSSGSLLGVGVMVAFALLSYTMSTLGYSPIIFIISYFLQPRIEESFIQTLVLLDNDITMLWTRPVAILLLLLSCITVYVLIKKR